MQYKGYIGKIELGEDGVLYGEVIKTRDVITFQGTSIAELINELQNSVEAYLAFCAETGKIPDIQTDR